VVDVQTLSIALVAVGILIAVIYLIASSRKADHQRQTKRSRARMRRDDDFKTESLAFIEKVKNVRYYDEERWFRSVYSTLYAFRTIEGGSLSGDDKTALQGLLFSAIHNLKSFSVDDYDTWFYDLAKLITNNVAKLSFGHAQKLINILMKYHFVYFYSDLDDAWKTQYAWLEPYFNYLHSPIDRKVLTNVTNKYAMDIPPNKMSWTKWNWEDKTLYETIQHHIQQHVENTERYYQNRLYFEMKELWITPTKKVMPQKSDYQKEEILPQAYAGDSLKNALTEIVNEINKQSDRVFELNMRPRDYYSIQLAGAKRYKNVVCFVKNEPVLSISKYANLNQSRITTTI
jgi:hypothetical protein